MSTHSKGQKYIVSASIDPEVGKVLDERKQKFGINRSFEVEQALRQYFGLKNGEGPTVRQPAQPPTPTSPTISVNTGTLAADKLSNMATTQGSLRSGNGGSVNGT